ncbi:MAG: pro-sigmaK processing inhibitor BofA family protein [Hominenteromicrobium sp.]
MKFIKRLLGSALLGVGALAALYALTPFTGIAVTVSRLSVLIAAVLGVPGVTLMVLLQLL